ncbi:MAG: hypothetical protein ACREC6_13225 [Hyphomicrobiaceae bacterium]
MVGKLRLWMLAVVGAASAGSPLGAEPVDLGRIETYRNERFGFVVRYPTEVFEPAEQQGSSDGRVFASRDGDARLIASAGLNTSAQTLQEYRRFVMEQTYQGAIYDYKPVRKTWFVLSGTLGDKMFYERIVFACGGEVIYGWQMTYPTARRDFYDRVVETIHRHYRPGKGENNTCNQPPGD